MTLVDSSVWIDFLNRRGSAVSQSAVARLIAGGEAAYCGVIEFELMAGARTPRDAEYVRMALDLCARLPVNESVWPRAGRDMFQMSKRGLRVGMGDVLVAAVALAHDVPVLTRDADFERIRETLWPELKVETLP